MQTKQPAENTDKTEERIFLSADTCSTVTRALGDVLLIEEDDDWDPIGDGGYTPEEVEDIDSDVPLNEYSFLTRRFFEDMRNEPEGASLSHEGLGLLIELLLRQIHGYEYVLEDLQKGLTYEIVIEDVLDDLEVAAEALSQLLAEPAVRGYSRRLARAAIARERKHSRF